jgi:hypothetical protein
MRLMVESIASQYSAECCDQVITSSCLGASLNRACPMHAQCRGSMELDCRSTAQRSDHPRPESDLLLVAILPSVSVTERGMLIGILRSGSDSDVSELADTNKKYGITDSAFGELWRSLTSSMPLINALTFNGGLLGAC